MPRLGELLLAFEPQFPHYAVTMWLVLSSTSSGHGGVTLSSDNEHC